MTNEEMGESLLKKHKKKKRRNIILLIVAALIVIFFMVPKIVKLPSYKKNSPTYQQYSTPQTQFKILSVNGKWKYDRLYVIGEVKNIGTIAAGVQVEAIARNKSGDLVASNKFWPNSINNIYPGRSRGIEYPLTSDKSATRVELQIISTKVWE